MSSLPLRVLVGLVGVAVVVGLAVGIIYYVFGGSGSGRILPPIPPMIGEETVNMIFHNALTVPVIVIPIYGTATDTNHWTVWPPVFDQADPTNVLVPRSTGLAYRELAPGDTTTYNVLTAGMASAGFIVRVNCDPHSRICQMGDSVYIEELDGPTRNDLYRDKTGVGQVPFKPAIDTRVEFTWGCAYKDATLCGVNPSCITKPETGGCIGITNLMAANPGAKFSTDGLLYKPDGRGGHTNISLPPDQIGLASGCYYDISCVDGYTVPMILEVKRPPTGVTVGSKCGLADGTQIDAATAAWQPLASTAHLLLDFSQCPQAEILWPATRTVATIPNHSGDGYNELGGHVQFEMPWVTQGTPGALADTKLKADFAPGPDSATDLRQFRNPLDVAAVPTPPGGPWSIQDIIGCSSPCSVLTQNSAVSQMYPKDQGHVFTKTYMEIGTAPFASSDRGVTEVCCKPPAGNKVSDSKLQCNTSTWWTDPPGIAGDGPTLINVNFNYGFYVNVFAPSPGSATEQPWWDGTGSINPYAGLPQDEYVKVIRDDKTGQEQTTRAYSYAHDDAWNTIVCGTVDPVNEYTIPGSRGTAYHRYDVRVTIGTTPPA